MMMFSQVMVIVVSMTVMVMMRMPMSMMMVVAVPMIVLMRTIIGLERRCHLDAGKSMLREERLDLGPLLQPDAVG
jgi:hypothetical protein